MWARWTWIAVFALFLLYSLLSVSRSMALTYNYSAPSVVFLILSARLSSQSAARLPALLLPGRAPHGFARETLPPVFGPTAAAAAALPSSATTSAVTSPLSGDNPAGAELRRRQLVERSTIGRVCIGKDWYRFPSSFFLPEAHWSPIEPSSPAESLSPPISSVSSSPSSEGAAAPLPELGRAVGMSMLVNGQREWLRQPRIDLDFIDSDFGGLLPQHYSGNVTDGLAWATAPPAPNMNAANRRDVTRYVPIAQCDFVVDTALGLHRTHPRDAFAAIEAGSKDGKSADGEWELYLSVPMLDADLSPSLTRAFYVPHIWATRNKFVNFDVWRRTRPAGSGSPHGAANPAATKVAR